MDFDFSEAAHELAREARRFLEQQCPPSHVREHLDDPAGWSRNLWRQMSDLGWTALPFEERFGGLGRSFLDLPLLLGELGRALAPVPYLSSVALAGQAILRHGSDEQQGRWLPGIAAGERIGALALRDPTATPDDGGVGIEAVRDGAGWRLQGTAALVLDAPAADLFVVAAGCDEGEALFVVEGGFGVTARHAFDLARPLGDVRLMGAPGERLARPGTAGARRVAVAAVCAEMVGVAQKALDMSVSHAMVREQFGRPIGGFQAIKHRLAEMTTALEAARSGTMYACWAADGSTEDAEIAVSVAKSVCGDACGMVAGEAIQVHGGIGYTWEHDIHLYARRLKSLGAFLGDAAFHREVIARLLDL